MRARPRSPRNASPQGRWPAGVRAGRRPAFAAVRPRPWSPPPACPSPRRACHAPRAAPSSCPRSSAGRQPAAPSPPEPCSEHPSQSPARTHGAWPPCARLRAHPSFSATPQLSCPWPWSRSSRRRWAPGSPWSCRRACARWSAQTSSGRCRAPAAACPRRTLGSQWTARHPTCRPASARRRKQLAARDRPGPSGSRRTQGQ
mmetsp:Transcript_94172/g.243245  ORF Transcript_94172/g.243245 Transcript_94172/m.243245 type:complete len:201 (+) Transcript_94172:1152-1754(+)